MTRPLPLTERDFQRQVVELAHLMGWEDFHVRAGRTADSWRVPGSGTMAAGWPDLVLVHPKRGRLIFAELKAHNGKLTPAQQRVLPVLNTLSGEWGTPDSRATISIEVVIWRPEDWELIELALSRDSRNGLEDGAVA